MRRWLGVIGVLVLAIGLPAERPFSRRLFDGRGDVLDAKGMRHSLHINIQDWNLDDEEGGSQTIAVPAFSVFNLLSGGIETTIGSQTLTRRTDEFWTANAGSTMKVKVLSEGAILRTIRVTEMRLPSQRSRTRVNRGFRRRGEL